MVTARLALGTVQWGLRYGIANRAGRPDLAEVRAMLDLAAAAGVRTLDTARAYGASEAVIGEATGPDPAWEVMTKLGPDVRGAAAARASLAASRAALRRDVLPAVLLHRAHQRAAASGAIWDVLLRERDAKRIGRLGVSAGSPDEAFAALADPDVDVVQVAASLLDQRLARAGFFARAASAGRTVVVRSVFLQGAAHLTPAELPSHLAALRPIVADVRAWCASAGLPPAAAYLAYAKKMGKVIVLLGCETAGQLGENLRLWDGPPVDGAELGRLAGAVPDLPEAVLNPARWAA